MLIAALLLCAHVAVGDISRGRAQGFRFAPPSLASVRHVNKIEPKPLAAQLFSRADSFFQRVLAKPVDPR